MPKILVYLSILFFLIMESSCTTVDLSKYEPGSIIIRGTMHYRDVEGGCWQFVTEENKTFEITGDMFVDRFINNSYAELVVHPTDDASSICMVGKLAEVLDIIHISPH